ncbi:MAG TPA: AraC family transcriptional regulator [Pseudorhizobium sp.]|nr:AraC family transcriptional regulator [Pseudorhizobium sp.]
MISVPLPFVAGLLFALVLYRTLRGVETPGPRHYFFVFLAAYALQGILVGLRFGYGMDGLGLVQPVTAALMPPLGFLAFRALAGAPLQAPWRHLAAPLSVALSVAFLPPLVDPLLATIFVVYGVMLFRITVNDAPAIAEASLDRVGPALRAARLTAGLMIFFAVTDGLISVAARLYGPDSIPLSVGVLNLIAIVVVVVYYFLPLPQAPAILAASATRRAASPEDHALLTRVEQALDSDQLYAREDLSLARLARRAGLPPREVSAVINRVTGLNVSQFVNNRRLAHACHLLEETDQPLSTVMFASGFGTKSNFNREFRRVTGTSPSQWRALQRDRTR